MNSKKRIGFIAMSGVRAHNAELTKLGLTLPGFVDRNKIIASLPSLGLLTLAGLTPKKFDVEYHEIADLKKLPELPVDFDLVAISTFTAQLNEAYEVADFYRAKKIPVVMGGITVSSLPEEAKEHCTSVVIGEGEPLWPEVLRDFERGALKPFYTPSKEFDLADAPMPRFDLLDPDKYNRLTVQTSRGCPHRCEFCASSILLTPRYKVKPVEKVIAEIHEIKKIWPRPFIEFADDNSFVHRGHYKKLLRELAKEKLRWFTEADVSVAEDDELLGLMRDSGCQQVLIGLESPPVGGGAPRQPLRRGVEIELEIAPAGFLPGRHRENSILRHHRQRLFHPRPRRRHAGSVRRRAQFRARLRALRGAGDVHDGVSRHAALRAAEARRPHPPRPRVGTLHAVRHQFPPEKHERCTIAKRFLETGETTLFRRGNP